MKLSEAIRVGIRTTKAQRSEFILRRGKTVYTCAIGAAIVAEKPEVNDWDSDILECVGFNLAEDLFPQLLDTVQYQFPETAEAVEVGLWTVITSLNDTHRWRRDSIAKVVEQLGY